MSCERVPPVALRRATEQCRAGQNLSLQEAEGLVDHGFHGWARMVSEVGGAGDSRFEI